VVVPPLQGIAPAETEAESAVTEVTVLLAVAVHPLLPVAVTVKEPAEETDMEAELEPVLHV
jgi:hypothetical protein